MPLGPLGTIVEFARAKSLLPPNPDRWGVTGMVVKAMGADELLTLDRKVFLTSWPNCDISLSLIREKFAKNMENWTTVGGVAENS
jgi:hypothetical protein